MEKKSIEIKYPWPLPAAGVLLSMLLIRGVFTQRVHPGTVVVTLGAVGLTIYLLAYRIVINRREICVRRAPFFNTCIPVQELTYVIEERTLVLVTKNSKFPLWGLSLAGRERLFDILPRHIEVLPSVIEKRGSDPSAALRVHKRWTLFTGIGFFVTAGLSIPFYSGNAFHEYWGTAGRFLILLCLCFLIATVVGGAIYWALWSTKRDIERIDGRMKGSRHGG